MQANWIIIAIVIAAAIALIFFLNKQNHKDQKDYEEYLNNQSRPKDEKDIDDGL
ncbi:hypothetical protein HUK80_09290 [Flavobacterium sp. MAH-1]|uniref:Uncharacterized protein n=1 Tax=Flavobacterium agri TaxID=2743471 RepID=A0A7Y8Y1Z1_9FLAO|nr:hypothetical protein [Flavobacterium agri]NUY81087.1 hypothetical protein [Flavobacterium agri]NYA71111.1 hypothetical protein [Flavobacterium agri]